MQGIYVGVFGFGLRGVCGIHVPRAGSYLQRHFEYHEQHLRNTIGFAYGHPTADLRRSQCSLSDQYCVVGRTHHDSPDER